MTKFLSEPHIQRMSLSGTIYFRSFMHRVIHQTGSIWIPNSVNLCYFHAMTFFIHNIYPHGVGTNSAKNSKKKRKIRI